MISLKKMMMEDKKIIIENTDKYIPGTCNIGKDEIRLRRNMAILMGILSVALVTLLLLLHAHKLWRLVLFLTVTGFVIGIQQWYHKFCVNFGMRGVFNFDRIGTTTSVEEAEMRKLDKGKSIKMILIAVLIGIIFTIAFYLLP